jgi:xanthine dehydrogenase accessory factor
MRRHDTSVRGAARLVSSGQHARPVYTALRAAVRDARPVALATVVSVSDDARAHVVLGAKLLVDGRREMLGESADGAAAASGADGAAAASGAGGVRRDGVTGNLGDPDLDRVVARDAVAAVESGLTVTRHYGAHGEARQRSVEVFIEVFGPPPRMVIFGAVDFTSALAAAGKLLGYHVVVCDARAVFATRQRFPMADEVVVGWPDRYLDRAGGDLGPRDVVCVLTHDTKFDVPAVLAALRTRVGYIGAMGSRRTHEARWTALIEAGADPEELTARLMSPIGLDIGSRTPEETAVAICAEIIAKRTGAIVPSLRSREGPIHAR